MTISEIFAIALLCALIAAFILRVHFHNTPLKLEPQANPPIKTRGYTINRKEATRTFRCNGKRYKYQVRKNSPLNSNK